MPKRPTHKPGYCASLLTDVCDHSCSKYRPKVKPTVMGIYEVQPIVANRVRGANAEYFIEWKKLLSDWKHPRCLEKRKSSLPPNAETIVRTKREISTTFAPTMSLDGTFTQGRFLSVPEVSHVQRVHG